MPARPAWNYVFFSVIFIIVLVGILLIWAKEVSLGDLPSAIDNAVKFFRGRILRQ